VTVAARDEVRAADGMRLVRRRWPSSAGSLSRARLLLVHGVGEHLGRYEEAGESLAARGIEVSGCDLRGCGLSDGRRGHVRRWSDYHLDLDACCPAPPFAVLAHSMGGLVALDWIRARGARAGAATLPEALILSGPLLDVAVPVSAWKLAAAGVLSRLAPGLRIPTGIPLPWLCTDSAAVARFERDPLRDPKSTPRWYVEMQAARARVLPALAQFRIPAQFHLAGDERIVSAAAVEAGFAAWGGPKELLRWPAGRHEILQEPFRQDVLTRMADFVLERAPV
jgi:lysophospholipase